MITINREGLNPMQLGRLNKCLKQMYNFGDEGIMPLEQFIKMYGKGKKLSRVMLRNGNIKEDVPSLTTIDKVKGTSIDIPKVVYNAICVPDAKDILGEPKYTLEIDKYPQANDEHFVNSKSEAIGIINRTFADASYETLEQAENDGIGFTLNKLK